jgi:hypothetical protein
LSHLESWMKKNLKKQDEVVLEMTTNRNYAGWWHSVKR